ncbi:MAG TPA: zinc-binding dehydrogenase [Mycobacteriales bacterium]|nr:zinc-binding dehydrogenase [Mycobacteriales bacterium]
MHAIRQYEFGPAENLRYEVVDDPEPGPGQVRIAVTAAGIHLLDTNIRAGVHGGPFGRPVLPMTPGREVAGTVDQLGDGVDPSWLGKRVTAHLGQASGGYAELAIAAATALHALPASLSDDAGVAMIGTGRTAMGIIEAAAFEPDDVVLITAAAGGLGTLLVQEARSAGATTVGVASGPAKVMVIRDMGADIAADYTAPGWAAEVQDRLGERRVSVVLDGVGGELGRAALELIGPGGRILLYGWSSGTPTPLSTEDLYARALTATVPIGPRMLNRPGGLRQLEEAAITAAGTRRLVPIIGQTFALEDAAAAHRALESRATTGKVVLKP